MSGSNQPAWTPSRSKADRGTGTADRAGRAPASIAWVGLLSAEPFGSRALPVLGSRAGGNIDRRGDRTSHGDNQPREQQFEIDVADPSSTTSKGAEQDQASS